MSGYDDFIGKKVLITDFHRGVYAGEVVEILNNGSTVRVVNARHCFYFAGAPGHEGTYGLATIGPTDECRIGPSWNGIINDVSKLVNLSDEAAANWEKAKWAK